MSGMFNGVTLPSLTYNRMLVGFSTQNVVNGLSFSAGNSLVCGNTAQTAKNKLITMSGWQITDGGNCVVSEILSDSFESQ